ncbi:MAG: hypothetical protein NC913_02595 [Candidatus Omnitrophica bacterium]|nr:hypothetical protein [Candidatus Omnitrophota bacterium]
MEIKPLLKEVKERKYKTLEELTTEVARLIPYIAEKQTRYKVSVYPDERDVRYYIIQNLVDKPTLDKEGRFGYRHLLQILAIKKLQSQYLPLKKIKEIIGELDEEELEKIIIVDEEEIEQSPFTLASATMRRDFKNVVNESMVFFTTTKQEFEAEKYKKTCEPEQWTRVLVQDGVEINIRSDIMPVAPEKRKRFIEKIAAKLRIFIEDEKTKEESHGR